MEFGDPHVASTQRQIVRVVRLQAVRSRLSELLSTSRQCPRRVKGAHEEVDHWNELRARMGSAGWRHALIDICECYRLTGKVIGYRQSLFQSSSCDSPQAGAED